MSGEALPMIGRLLEHASVQATARFAHLSDESTLVAAQKIGDALAGALDRR